MIIRSNPYVATLKENAELLNNTQDNRSTRKIVLAVAAAQVKFTAGDHLAILPSNRPELVEVLFSFLLLFLPLLCSFIVLSLIICPAGAAREIEREGTGCLLRVQTSQQRGHSQHSVHDTAVHDQRGVHRLH